ncbi:hypothetical protein RN001_010783 [Aquatica leii]|uniref:Adenylate kinase 9 n=1 Tax=Aquatica leii TaxID=1421715 RepID=A0AAN7P729_9COLE|nr:hypothetical protein RN001_010783 [Aquatica leii]
MTDFYKKSSEYLSEFKSTQTVIINKKYLEDVSRVIFPEKCEPKAPSVQWYPFTNSYYPFTEDVDIYSRVNHVLSTGRYEESLTHVTDCHTCACIEDGYTEKEAQLQYLTSKPTSFFIIGKPGIGEEQLGKLLADYWNCVYIEPEILIREEIENDTDAGKCIEFNLRNGRSISADVVVKLLEKRVKSQTAQHRGFVICGFPLIPNDLYEEDFLTTQSVFSETKKICDDLFDTVIEVGVPPSKTLHLEIEGEDDLPEPVVENETEEQLQIFDQSSNKTPIDLGTETSDICFAGFCEKDFEAQLELIFSQFERPFIIIYMVSGNADVITKRQNQRFNIYSQQVVDLELEDADRIIYTHFSQIPGAVNDEVPEDFIEIIKSNVVYNSQEQRLLVDLPKDWKDNVVTLLDRYRQKVLPTVESHVLKHDLQNFIRVDGRISPVRMFHAVKQRLKILPIQKVIVPEKFTVQLEPGVEAQSQNELNFDGLSLDECFGLLFKKYVPSPIYKWTLSDWRFKCPVSFHDGIEKDGDPNYAVHFMNKIFFLADSDCCLRFKRNPRPFLVPLEPQPQYRICVMGPRSSGKSSVSRCLSYLFNCKILKYDRMLHDFFKAQVAQYERELRAKAMERAFEILNEIRLNEWRNKEKDRLEKVVEWIGKQRAALPSVIKIKKAIRKCEQQTVFLEISSFPTSLSYKDVTEVGSKDSLDDFGINQLQEMLVKVFEDIDLPDTLSLDDFQRALVDDEKICEYLPEWLQPESLVMASPSDEFVRGYVEEAVQNDSSMEVELTLEHKTSVLLDGIKTVEDGCWIIDGMLPKRELFNAMYPDNTPQIVVLLKDDSSQYPFRGRNEHENFREFFYEIQKKEAAWRAPSLTGTYIERTVSNVVDDLIDDVIATSDPEEADGHKQITMDAYKKEVVELIAIESIFSEYKIDLITVTITNKSIKMVMKEVARLIENRYRQIASVFTELDRAQELEELGEPDALPEEEVDDEERGDNEDMLQNRRYGDTFYYCPVAFNEHFVLWKGKNEFTVKYDNKIYMLSSEFCMNTFLDYPFYYILKKPPDEIPPPRICIVGPYGSGKASVAKDLSSNLGLYNAMYENLLKTQIAPRSKMCFHEVLRNAIGGSKTEHVRNYLINDKALDEDLLEKIVSPLWTDEYRKMHGFVLSGFPKRQSDVDFMLKHFTIPDIIIELSINQGEVRNRLASKRAADLKMLTQNERRQEIVSNWQEQYETRYRELLHIKKAEKLNASDEAIDRPYLTDLAEVDEANDLDEVPETEEMIQEIENILSIELPQPEFWPSEEDLLKAYVNDLENQSVNELVFLRAIKDACNDEGIPWVTIDAGLTKEKVLAQAMRLVEKHKFRNRSLFERVYEVSVDLSEKLLSTGYYFLSKFGKTCPVQAYDDYNPVQMYLPHEKQFQLYPVVHRQYIYYLGAIDSLNRFKQDPLKYVTQKFMHDRLLPLKLAVIGPPKSGKTTLAERFKRDFGMQVISRGKACRYVLSYLKFSELARQMEPVLREGEELPDEIVIKAVDACSFDGRSITQGFVLDGFPETIGEVRQLTFNGLIPHLVIDLHAEPPIITRFCTSMLGKNMLPPFSKTFINHRYQNHLLYASDFRNWLDKEYQNNVRVTVQSCKWAMWNDCLKLALSAFFEVKCYHRYAFKDYVLRLSYMQITPLEFIQRQSLYKDYCPCCLFFQNILNRGGEPPDRTGLVQFRMYFYYLCHDHIDLFIKDPEKFISPYNPRELPRDLPTRVTDTGLEFYAEGTCVVCYWTNQPKYVIRPGCTNFAVSYREAIYLFDEEQCLREFMREPHRYFAIKITYKSLDYAPLLLKDLPIQGFLQQYDALKLIKAITNTGILRPVVPGLDIKTSACLNIGLHLVTNNPKTSPKYLPLYKEAEQKFNERRLNLMNYLAQMKKMINPYLYYDEPLPKFVDPISKSPSIAQHTFSSTNSERLEMSISDETEESQ